MATSPSCDLLIVGGGLAGGLIALALKTKRPTLDVRIVEAGPTIGGNHFWSFFAADVARGDRWILTPLVAHAWPGYRVAFPGHARVIDQPYYTIDSARLDQVVRQTLPPDAILSGRQVTDITPTAALLYDGEQILARGVIDARGAGQLSLLELGWQKFVGRELRLAEPHGAERPVVMDATVEQIDGYRFVYCLPFGPKRMFVEDTYYSDGPELDVKAIQRRIGAYAAAQGWQVKRREREETGVLPVALGGDFAAYWTSGGKGIAKAGVRAGLFHPTTGYSLPDAVRMASVIARTSDLSGAGLHELTHRIAARAWQDRRFYRMLDRMLFKAAEPNERYRVLERFYRLNPRLIGRFYAARSTMADKARILVGKPPVPIKRAVAALQGLT